MILKVIGTGRQWGDKVEEKISKVTLAGVTCVIREFDAWEGGDGALVRQQFFRFTVLEVEGTVRDDRGA